MKQPLEFYGVNTASDVVWKGVLSAQQCPYTASRCVKQRKSNPEQTIGACVIGYQEQPLIICPKRFLQHHQIFVDAVALIKTRGARYVAVPEIMMPGGSVDYFVVAMRGDEVVDYVGLEIQGLDTTSSGGIWAAREDLMRGVMQDNYGYGVNWKMSAKTILMQLHHKAKAFEQLGKKLLLVIQRQFFEYMQREFQTEHFQSAQTRDTVHFHLYDCVEINESYRLSLESRISTSVGGIERMLKLGNTTQILTDDVIAIIKRKLSKAITLNI
jgi:hypothetical protein